MDNDSPQHHNREDLTEISKNTAVQVNVPEKQDVTVDNNTTDEKSKASYDNVDEEKLNTVSPDQQRQQKSKSFKWANDNSNASDTADADIAGNGGHKHYESFLDRLSLSDKVLVLVAFTTALLLILFVFRWTSADGSVSNAFLINSINLSIYLLFIFGCYSFYTNLKEIRFELNTSKEVSKEANSLDLKHPREGSTKPSKEELVALVPVVARQSTYVGRLLIRVIMDAQDFVYDERDSILSPYKIELHRKANRLEGFQSAALRIGILGTFIGLILAIIDLSEMNENFKNGLGSLESTSQLGESVQRSDLFVGLSEQLFGAMQFAFGTSISGLVVSLLITVLSAVLLSRTKSAIEQTEKAANFMIELARRSDFHDAGITYSLQRVNHEIETLKQELIKQTNKSTNSVNELSLQLDNQSTSFQKSNLVLHKLAEVWASNLQQNKEHQENITDLQTKQAETISSSLTSFDTNISHKQSLILEQLSSSINLIQPEKINNDIKESYSSIGESINSHFANLTKTMTKNYGAIEDISSQLSTNTQNVLNSNSTLATSLSEDLKSLNTQLSQFAKSNQALSLSLSTIEGSHKNLLEQLKVDNKLDSIHALHKSTESQIPKLIDCHESLNSTIQQLNKDPISDSMIAKMDKITSEVVKPFVREMTMANENYQVISDRFSQLNNSNQKIYQVVDKLIEDVSESKRFLSKRVFKWAIYTNSFVGLVLAISMLVGMVMFGVFIYSELYK